MRQRNQPAALKVFIVITYILMITVNALANILPINGYTTGELSDKYENLFAPAGFTFSIWGFIYLLLALHIVFQLGLFQKGANRQLLRQTGIYFCITSVLNALWILLWHNELLLLSVLVMIAMLVCLIRVSLLTARASLTLKESFFVRLPFSVYFGWITIATIANISAFLVSIEWTGFGLSETAWTIIILFTGAAIGIVTLLRQRDIAYGLVLIWAYYGIYSKHTADSGFDHQYPAVITSVLICLVLIALAVIFTGFKKIRT